MQKQYVDTVGNQKSSHILVYTYVRPPLPAAGFPKGGQPDRFIAWDNFRDDTPLSLLERGADRAIPNEQDFLVHRVIQKTGDLPYLGVHH